MTARLNPYLNFRGDAREAMGFNQAVLGGDLDLNTFDEFGMEVSEEEKQHVMHSQLTVSDTVVLMGADVPSQWPYQKPAGVPICLSGTDEATLRGWWDGLSDGGTVDVPLEKAPWGDVYGQLTDKFGIEWMFNIGQDQPTDG